ncbi:MAG: YaiO family outer membrane beta-barrel protein [Blastocatellia bacterium]|nr:YaiO family outer membrane beta-barrel protein [Blastocatellia bacterium]
MKFLACFIYLICLFLTIYGQNEVAVSPPESEKENERKTEVQVTTNYEVLSKNLGSWKSVTINVRHDFSKRQVLYGFYQKAYRASVSSDTATVGLYQPLSKNHTLLLEMSASPGHQFLPKWSGMAQLETKLSPTTFLNTGYRRTIYRDAKLNIANIGVEKYWKAYRFTYTASIAKPENDDVTFSNRIQADKYYGEKNSTINADVTFGNEVASFFGDGKVLKSNIFSIGVGGKHWFNNRFGVNYRASFHRQGEFYNRGGTTLGVIYRF